MDEQKKYELVKDQTANFYGKTLYRIRALKDFCNVKKGDIGGFVEKEDNLSHQGRCWVYGNALVCDHAKLYNDALIDGNAKISDYAMVYDHAIISGNAEVCGHAQAYKGAVIYGDAKVSEHAKIHGSAVISGRAKVYGHANVYENANIQLRAEVFCNAIVGGHIIVSDDAKIHGSAIITGNYQIKDDAEVLGNTSLYIGGRISGNAYIKRKSNLLMMGPVGSRDAYITFMRTADDEIYVTTGCFSGNIDHFRKQVIEKHGHSKHARAYLAACQMAEIQLDSIEEEGQDE